MSDAETQLLKHQVKEEFQSALENAKKEIRESLKSDYVLLKKGRLWAALGGAIALLTAAGIISYKSAIEAAKESIKTPVVQAQLADIEGAHKKAKASLEEISNIVDLKTTIDDLNRNAVRYDQNVGLKVQWENHHDHPVGMVANAAWQISREPPKRP